MSGAYLGVHIRAKGQKRAVAFASLHAAGQDHTLVEAGPGTYVVEVTSVSGSEYTITVKQ